jgi:hypothetical protein
LRCDRYGKRRRLIVFHDSTPRDRSPRSASMQEKRGGKIKRAGKAGNAIIWKLG